MENKTNTKAQNTKAQETKADNKPLTGEVVQNSGLPIGVDATLREKAIAKIQKAVVSFNAKHWAVAQAIYDVRMSDNFTKSFKNLEDFAVAYCIDFVFQQGHFLTMLSFGHLLHYLQRNYLICFRFLQFL